jgi:phosphoglycerol transferase MdoB-like AlkP superfamily enzyme
VISTSWVGRHESVRLYGLQNIGTISAQPQFQSQPKFVFVHVVVPHPPFLFNEDGSTDTLNVISLSDKFEKEKYAAQVKFLQRQVLAMLDQLDKNPRKKVVIIQGDHGPALQNGSDGNPSPAFLRERMRILNAYRLPAANPRLTNTGATYPATTYATTIGADSIYDGITPVNSFRVVLNRYFDAKLPCCQTNASTHPTHCQCSLLMSLRR